LQFIGGPVRYDGLAKEQSTPPPLLGEHSTAILKTMGYDQATIDGLARMGILKIA
jgi:crotonobetainyl-CoA:carnitine CoA-transferase CaiB-like acyl-CoA transferase